LESSPNNRRWPRLQVNWLAYSQFFLNTRTGSQEINPVWTLEHHLYSDAHFTAAHGHFLYITIPIYPFKCYFYMTFTYVLICCLFLILTSKPPSNTPENRQMSQGSPQARSSGQQFSPTAPGQRHGTTPGFNEIQFSKRTDESIGTTICFWWLIHWLLSSEATPRRKG
jgi:hypothetical protein